MDRKILVVGSIIAAVTLVLVSFNSVVGFQTKTTLSAKSSPLFSVRTNRAIDESKDTITCDYIGKGKESGILLPICDRNLSQIYKAIKRITQRDDETNKFITLLMNQVHQNKMIPDENLYRLIYKVPEIKNPPERLIKYLIDEVYDPLIFGWTIINPICLLIILGFVLLFGFWTSIISIYLGYTCDHCCYIPLPETLGI